MVQGIFVNDNKTIREILDNIHTIAVVGASDNPDRPSNEVMKFLIEYGFNVIPVNPGLSGQTLMGKTVYPRLKDIPFGIDMVDVFRNTSAVASILDEILELKIMPKVLWTQIGVYDEVSAQRAMGKGIIVVMDRCPKKELS